MSGNGEWKGSENGNGIGNGENMRVFISQVRNQGEFGAEIQNELPKHVKWQDVVKILTTDDGHNFYCTDICPMPEDVVCYGYVLMLQKAICIKNDETEILF